MIIRGSVVLRETVFDDIDWRFDDLSKSYLDSDDDFQRLLKCQ